MAPDPHGLMYAALDGLTTHWPSGDYWEADRLDDFDLMQLRTHLVRALLKVDAEADNRRLLLTWNRTPAQPVPANPTLSTRPEE